MRKRYTQIELPSPDDHDPHPRLLVDGYGIHAGESFRPHQGAGCLPIFHGYGRLTGRHWLASACLNSCSTIDCSMDGINYSGATLDGCSFGRVTAGTIHDLNRAVITQGGATEEKCRQNRDAIYRALGVKGAAA